MRLQRSFIIAALGIIALGSPLRVSAMSGNTSFPSCLNPRQTADITYADGNHGIAGDYASHTGSDSVYKLEGNNKVLQCFCGRGGQAVQTNWIKTDTLTTDEISTLKSQGWIAVPFGADWGLDNSSYLAQNTSYTCLASANVQATSVTNTSHDPTSSAGNGLAQLANTGNIVLILSVVSIGITALLLGFFLKRNRK